MKITYAKKESRIGILKITVDDDDWREIHTSIFGKNPTFPKTCTTLSELEEWFQANEYKFAMQYTLKSLLMKNQPSVEMQKKLEQRLVTPSTIQRIIAECEKLGYINDQNWLEGFIRQQKARNIGPNAIKMKLRAKGITKEETEEAVSEIDSDTQIEQITNLLRTRYRKRDLTDYKERQKVIASLIRKGFQFEEILKTLNHSEQDID